MKSNPKTSGEDLSIIKSIAHSIFHLFLENTIELFYWIIDNLLFNLLKFSLKFSYKTINTYLSPLLLIAHFIDISTELFDSFWFFCFNLINIFIFWKYSCGCLRKLANTVVSNKINLFSKTLFNTIIDLFQKLISNTFDLYFNIANSFSVIICNHSVHYYCYVFTKL